MANYAVIGLEKFGYFVARFLSERGEKVLAIDFEETRVDRVKTFVDKAVLLDARNPGVLDELGIRKMDAVMVCFNDKLEESAIITHILTELGVDNIICLAANEKHEKIMQILGASRIIFPERQAALSLVESLLKPLHRNE